MGDKTQGEAIVAGMNLLGYDAMALGPKELSLGLDVLRQRLAEAEFPMLSANVVLSDTGELLAAPYVIQEIGGFRVAIIGLTRVPKKVPVGFQLLDPAETAARYVSELADQADTIVLLTNVKYTQALPLVRTVPGIHLLVAAAPDVNPQQAVRMPDTGTLAVAAEAPIQRHTGRWVGKLVVTVGSDGRLALESWQAVSLAKSFADDPEMAALLESYQR